MAYNRYNNNPDSLPPHAEPNSNQPMYNQNQNRPPPPPGQRPYGYNNGPQNQQNWNPHQPPPQHQQQQQQQQWNQPPKQQYGGHGGPGGFGGGQGYNNDQRPRPQFGFLPTRPPPPPIQRSEHNDYLWRIFKGVDTNNSNSVSERELSEALVNSNYQRFDPTTIQMMIKMFDFDRSGSIDFPEFCSLWNFLNDWRKLFDRFDKDRSGAISFMEFTEAMNAFGYKLSPDFMNFFFSVYVPRGTNEISFDLFVQACVNLKRLTDVFKLYDHKQSGHITLSFEEFLGAFLSQRL